MPANRQSVILIQQVGNPAVFRTNYTMITWVQSQAELSELKAWMTAYGFDTTVHQVTEATSFGDIYGEIPPGF